MLIYFMLLGNNGTQVKNSYLSHTTGYHGNKYWVRTTFFIVDDVQDINTYKSESQNEILSKI